MLKISTSQQTPGSRGKSKSRNGSRCGSHGNNISAWTEGANSMRWEERGRDSPVVNQHLPLKEDHSACVCVVVYVCDRPLRGQHGEDVRLRVAENPKQLQVRGKVSQQAELHLAEVWQPDRSVLGDDDTWMMTWWQYWRCWRKAHKEHSERKERAGRVEKEKEKCLFWVWWGEEESF